MLLRHGVQYLVARGLPGVLNFIAIAVYTRLVNPDQYGAYTLTIAAVGAADALLLQWLRLALLRFMPAEDTDSDAKLSTIVRIFLALALGASLLTVIVAWLLLDSAAARWIVSLGATVFLVQGMFELTVERERSALSPLRYGGYVGVKSVVGLVVGASLAAVGMGAEGLLIGLVVSMALPLVIFKGVAQWAGAFRARFDRQLAVALVRYGLPLAATATLGFVISSSDRFMLAFYIDQSAAGKYAVGYDLAQFTLGILLSIVNLAAYPLIVSALETRGAESAREMLRWTFRLLLAVGLPAAVGMIFLAENISAVMVGAEFRDVTAGIIPLIAVAALLAGLKSFYFDLAFQLGRSTITQLCIVLVSAAANVGLNAWLIPVSGIAGAVYATLAAYSFALLLSWWLGRNAFAVPLPDLSTLPIVLGTALMAGALLPLRAWSGPVALVVQVVVGVAVFAAGLLIVDRRFFAKLAGFEASGIAEAHVPQARTTDGKNR